MLNAMRLTDHELRFSGKSAAVRFGNSILWLDPELDVLPQKEEIKRRHRELVRNGHDKQVRPRRQSKKHDYDCEPV